jgi:hypothetical protein
MASLKSGLTQPGVAPAEAALQILNDELTAMTSWLAAQDDPEPQIAATALLGLWRIQFQALSKYLDGTRTPAQVHQAVSAEVNRAAQVIDTGLRSFPSSRVIPANAATHRPPAGTGSRTTLSGHQGTVVDADSTSTANQRTRADQLTR